MENNIENDIEKINNYIKYLDDFGNQYCNAFEVLNIQENTLTELIAWLLDVGEKSKSTDDILEIKRTFFDNFMKLLLTEEKEKYNGNYDIKYKQLNEIKNFEKDFLKSIKSGIEVDTQKHEKKGQVDIIIKNRTKQFLCIVENKIAAPLNICQGKTQIENYNIKYTEEEYNNYIKKFVFLCGNKDFYPTLIVKKHCKGGDYKGDYAESTIEYLLQNNGFFIIEHCDIIKILHKILLDKNHAMFENGILKPTTNENMKDIVNLFYNKLPTDKNNKKQQELKKQIENLSGYLNRNEQTKYLYKELKKANIKISGSITIPLREILNKEIDTEKIDTEKIINILCQYIEYCELHNGKVDYFQAYTKLIDGEPVWNICERLFENKNEWQTLKNKNIEELNNIIKYIELSKIDKFIEELKNYNNGIIITKRKNCYKTSISYKEKNFCIDKNEYYENIFWETEKKIQNYIKEKLNKVL